MSKRISTLFVTGLMGLSLIIFYLSLTLTKISLERFNEYHVIETKEFVKEDIDLKVHIFSNQKEMNNSLKKYVDDDITRAGFSVWSNTDNSCEIYILEPKSNDDLNTLGHELAHCIYGRWHYTVK